MSTISYTLGMEQHIRKFDKYNNTEIWEIWEKTKNSYTFFIKHNIKSTNKIKNYKKYVSNALFY